MTDVELIRNPKVIISVLNWMNYRDTIQCIHSIKQLNYSNYQIIVRDNASLNDSFLKLTEQLIGIRVERSNLNLGFAQGHFENYQLAKELGADLFWVLNADLEVEPETLEQLVQAFIANRNQIYGSVSLNPSDLSIVDFGGAEYSDPSNTSLTYNTWKGKSYNELIETHPLSYEVESVEGSSMLIPMEVIEKYGFMKTDFFMYAEETDYCYRLREKNVKSMVVTRSCVHHHNEGSTNPYPGLKVIPAYYRRRNALRFSIEHLGIGRTDALGYHNGIFQNLKTVLKGKLTKNKDLNYFYALGCWHAFLGKKGKVVKPEEFL